MRPLRRRLYVAWMPKIKKMGRFTTLQIQDKNESDKILFNNYLINEINSIEDSGRQLISVYAILIGAYLAIIMDNVIIATMKNIIRVLYSNYNNLLEPILIALIITLFPIFLWFYGTYKCSKVLRPENYVSAEQLKTDELSDYLNRIIKTKSDLFKRCYFLWGFGLLIVFVIFSANILGPIIFPYQDATTQYDQGNFDEAIKLCDISIAEYPGFELTWLLKGNCHNILGNYTEAIKCYDKLVELNPKSIEALKGKGMAYSNLFKYEEAIKNFDQAITLDQNCSETWFWKGTAHESLKQYDEAVKAFDKVTTINSKDPEAWYHKGNSFFSQGKYDEAIKCYDKAIKLDPNNAAARNNKVVALCNKGVDLSKQGKYEEAIKAYDAAIKLNPNYADAWSNKGITLGELGKTKEASTAFAKTKELGYEGQFQHYQ